MSQQTELLLEEEMTASEPDIPAENNKLQFINKTPKQKYSSQEAFEFDYEQINRELARREHLEFMQYCWQKPATEPFLIGIHTKAICEAIDKAIES